MGVRTASSLVFVKFVFFAVAQHVLGLTIDGSLPSSSSFIEFVGKFCFDYDADSKVAGIFSFTVRGKVLQGPSSEQVNGLTETDGPPCYGKCETQGSLYLFVYSDESEHWEQTQREWHELTCEEMLRFASFSMPLTPLDGEFAKILPVKERIRPRFWYFTFAACGVRMIEAPTFELHMQNPKLGIYREFGLDEEGTLQLQILAALLFLLLALSLRLVAKRSSAGEALRSRPILRLLIFSVVFSAIGAICRALHFYVFLQDGHGWGFFDVVGQMFVCGAKAMFALLLLLTAKGWSLFYGNDELIQRRLTLIIIASLLIFSAGCEIHADYAIDWNPSLYLYESWSGATILLLNMLLFLEGGRSMLETYHRESSGEVKVFYMMVSAASLVYFLTLPLLCLLSALFSPWVRLKYINRAEVASRFIASVLLAFCLKPSRLDVMINSRLEGFEADSTGIDQEETALDYCPVLRQGVD